jgi:hypothetical protein
MTKDRDWKAFCMLIKAADEVTVGKARSGAALTLMFRAMEEFEFAQIEAAIEEHIRHNKFAPTPADITRLISGSPEDKSAVAWRFFLRALEQHGFYDSVRFPDPAYHYAIIQLGGWERIGAEYHELTDKELQFREKGWRQLYEIGLRVAAWDEIPGKYHVPEYLAGFYERDNVSKGLENFIPPVVELESGTAIDPAKRQKLTQGVVLKILPDARNTASNL